MGTISPAKSGHGFELFLNFSNKVEVFPFKEFDDPSRGFRNSRYGNNSLVLRDCRHAKPYELNSLTNWLASANRGTPPKVDCYIREFSGNKVLREVSYMNVIPISMELNDAIVKLLALSFSHFRME